MYSETDKKHLFTTVILIFLKALTVQAEENRNRISIKTYFDMYYQISPQAHRATPAPANGPTVVVTLPAFSDQLNL